MENKLEDIVIPVPWGIISGKRYGENSATPVLCVHGRNDNLESFSSLIPLLPPNYYYVFIDLPGHGKSSHAEKGYILDVLWYAMCVKRVIMYLNWSKCCYIGHSLGGIIGFTVAAIYPDMFLKLVIIDILLLSYDQSSPVGLFLKERVFEPHFHLENKLNLDEAPTYALDDFVKKMKDSRKTDVSDKQIQIMAVRNLKRVGLKEYKFSNDQRNKISRNIYNSIDQIKRLANEISCPTLVILGKNSTVTYPDKILNNSPLNHIKNVIFQTIEGDHDVHMNHPEHVAHLLFRFLTQGRVSKL